jgi:hypothetical protein
MTAHIYRWLFAACLFTAILWLAGCSYISYERDGLTVTGFEFGTDKALAGFAYETKDGRVTVESLDKNQTNTLSAIAEGITKGAINGVKP